MLIPSWYAGTHRESIKCLTGPGRAIDPDRHFIVATNSTEQWRVHLAQQHAGAF